MNQAIFIGNLTRDANVITTQDGTALTTFTVAVNRKTKNGEDTTFVGCVYRNGEKVSPYLTKGKKVCVVGRVNCRAYKANDGTPKASLELSVTSLELIGTNGGAAPVQEQKAHGYDPFPTSDTIPF